MPRPLRLEYEGAWYHVMNRGANHQAIYLNDQQKTFFLSLLKCMSEKFYIEIHAYCLMDNHYHLLLRTPVANLSKAMRYLDSVYTQKFNNLQNRDGALFRGRYKSIVVEEDSYLLQVSKYIHLNPVSANILDSPQEYKWSSCRFYNEDEVSPSWLQSDFILNMIGGKKQYHAFMVEKPDDFFSKMYNKKHLPSIIGNKRFVEEKLATIKNHEKQYFLTDINRSIHFQDIEKIIEKIANYFQIKSEKLKAVSRGKKNDERMLAIFFSKKSTRLTHQKIADYFSLNRRSICAVLVRCEKRIEHDEKFRELYECLDALMSVNL